MVALSCWSSQKENATPSDTLCIGRSGVHGYDTVTHLGLTVVIVRTEVHVGNRTRA